MSLGLNRELFVTVLAGTGRVFEKMLCNSRVMGNNLRGSVCLAGMGKIRVVLGRMIVPDRPGNVLLHALLQSLECTSFRIDCRSGRQLDI